MKADETYHEAFSKLMKADETYHEAFSKLMKADETYHEAFSKLMKADETYHEAFSKLSWSWDISLTQTTRDYLSHLSIFHLNIQHRCKKHLLWGGGTCHEFLRACTFGKMATILVRSSASGFTGKVNHHVGWLDQMH